MSELEAYLEPRAAGSAIAFLRSDRTTIGRASEADVPLTEDLGVSRLHACIEQYSGGFVLRDLGSTNGTFLNGERLVGERPLKHGDELRVGSTVFHFREIKAAQSAAETALGEAPPSLTRREHEVLVELCRPIAEAEAAFGRPATVAEIAARLYIGQATVKFHLENLFTKFGLLETGHERRLALANEALRRGAVSFSELRLPPTPST